MRRSLGAAWLALLCAGPSRSEAAPAVPHDALQRPAAGWPADAQVQFELGLAIFNTPFQPAGLAPPRVAGLGPRFNLPACDACHNSSGRGSVPEGEEPPAQATVHAALRARGDDASRSYVMRLNANPGVPADAQVRVRWLEHVGRFADGERYALREPQLEVTGSRADLGALQATSLRIAPPLAGLGWLQAIPEQGLCPPPENNPLRLTGRCARVRDVRGQLRMGRFGWKAQQADVESQTADALATEMGIVSRWHSPLEQPGAAAEISDGDLAALVFFEINAQPPGTAATDFRSGRPGRQIFQRFGCGSCHRDSWQTGTVQGAPWRSNRRISPYTDLRLHDLGPALAAASGEGDATDREWRTAPLWGLSLTGRIGRGTTYLHDGRARSLTEAILWHGGEAQPSQERFVAATAADRRELLQFLEAL